MSLRVNATTPKTPMSQTRYNLTSSSADARGLITTVLFDLDGTLADSAPDLGFAMNEVLREHGLGRRPLDELRPHASAGSRGLIRHTFGYDESHQHYAAVRQRFLDIYSANLVNQTRLFPGMERLLAALEAHGLRWGVVTNKPAWLTDPLMRQLGLTQRAACIVSGDTTARPKPAPDSLHHACELLGCTTAECLYIGDAERDIVAGNEAGMTTLVALFGYIHPEETPEYWGAAGLINSPLDVLDWLGIDV